MSRPHWLSPGAKTWSPDMVLCFDTETVENASDTDLVHTLRCWDAVVTFRHDVWGYKGRRQLRRGESLGTLAELVEHSAELTPELWVFAHNLAFDLAVTQLPAILVAWGWELCSYALGSESSWWVLRHDGHKVVVCDSWSWLPCSLADIGKDLHKRKRPLPDQSDDLGTWHARCRVDAEILTAAVVTVMDWWDAHGLGRFQVTGAGCGWQAMRTKTGAKKVVVGPDGDRTIWERQAIYGGRKEVFQVGRFHGEWIADYDFVSAYPRIVAHHRLPWAVVERFYQLPAGVEPGGDGKLDVIARCRIETETPCVPVRIDADVWWPVGRFSTVLAGPEIAYARSVGASVTVEDGYLYKCAYGLREWATWCLDLLAAGELDTPPVIRRMAKGWSRSVVGRFAGHSSRITKDRPSFGTGWRLETGHNLTTGRPLEVLHIGGRELTVESDLDGAECFPAVLAFVEAHCRVALGQMITTRSPERIMQVNTDGWLERRVVRSAAYDVPGVPWPHHAVRKACVNEVVILGPDHLATPDGRRMAGVARDAVGSLADGFTWHDWPGLRWQLERASQGAYVRPQRSIELRPHFARRWVLANGETVPVATDVDVEGVTRIQPWEDTPGRREGDVLAPYQDERLASLTGSGTLAPVIYSGAGPVLPGRFAHRVRPLRMIGTAAARHKILTGRRGS